MEQEIINYDEFEYACACAEAIEYEKLFKKLSESDKIEPSLKTLSDLMIEWSEKYKDYNSFFEDNYKNYITLNPFLKIVRINSVTKNIRNACLQTDEYAFFKYLYGNYIKEKIENKELLTSDKNCYQVIDNDYVLYLDVDYTGTSMINKKITEIYMNSWFDYLDEEKYKYEYYYFLPETTPNNKQGAHILIFLDKPLSKDERKRMYTDIINEISEKVLEQCDSKDINKIFDIQPIITRSVLLPFAEKFGAKRHYKLFKHNLKKNAMPQFLGFPVTRMPKETKMSINQRLATDYDILQRIFSLLDQNIFKAKYQEANKLCLSLSCIDINTLPYFYECYSKQPHNTPTSEESFERLLGKYENNSVWALCYTIQKYTKEEHKKAQEVNLDIFKTYCYKYAFEQKCYSFVDYQKDYERRILSNFNMFGYLYRFIAYCENGDFIIHHDRETSKIITKLELLKMLDRYEYNNGKMLLPVGMMFLKYMKKYAPVYANLKTYGNVQSTDTSLAYYRKYKMLEPFDYISNISKCKKWLEMIKSTFKCEKDFEMFMKRENFRLNNDNKPSQCMFAWYGAGGEGKGCLATMISNLYFESKPALREQDFKREQLKLIYTAPYCFIDEGANTKTQDSILMKHIDALKVIWNSKTTSREMYGDYESFEIACDIDYITNNRTLNGLFQPEEMHRRIIPVERIKSTLPDYDTKWLFEMISDKDFMRSMYKYIKEESPYIDYKIGDVEKYNETNEYAKELIGMHESTTVGSGDIENDPTMKSKMVKITLLYGNKDTLYGFSKTDLKSYLESVSGTKISNISEYITQNYSEKFKLLDSYRNSKSNSIKFNVEKHVYDEIDDMYSTIEEKNCGQWKQFYVMLGMSNAKIYNSVC